MKKTALYRFFNKDGILLYVGVSMHLINRVNQHGKEKEWFEEIANINIEYFNERIDALDAEEIASKTENPLYNIKLRSKRSRKEHTRHKKLTDVKRIYTDLKSLDKDELENHILLQEYGRCTSQRKRRGSKKQDTFEEWLTRRKDRLVA